MITKRTDHDGYTEITLWSAGDNPAFQSYHVTCFDIDFDRTTDARTPPTARISLMASPQADVASTRRLAAEYLEVADVAEALQAEKRAAYVAR